MQDLPGFGGGDGSEEDPLIEEMRIQNALLLELVHTLKQRNEIEKKGHDEDYRRRSTPKIIEDNAIDLYERVDIERGDRR